MFNRSLSKILTIAITVTLGACAGDMVLDDPYSRGGSGEGGAGGGGGGSSSADAGTGGAGGGEELGSAEGRQYFQTYVQPILLSNRPKGSCALCHQGTNTANGPIFMGASQAENYEALLEHARMIGADPASSGLVTRGDHAGNSFCQGLGVPYNQCSEDEFAVISDWIRLENQY